MLGSIIISIARKPVVGKFELRMSRPLPHVYRLSRHAQFVSSYVNYIGKYICQAAHVRRLVRTYLVRIFPRRGLSTWCKTNLFFNSRKIFPTKEMHSIALIILYVKNWPKDQRVSISFWSQRFSRYRHVQTGYLTDLNWYTLEQVLTVPYGLLGRLDSACVSEAPDLCSRTNTRTDKVKNEFKFTTLWSLILIFI